MYLYETTAVIDALGTTTPVRLALGSGYNHPSGPGYFAPVVEKELIAAAITRTIYPDRFGFGLGAIDSGAVSAVAADGEWDWLADAGFGKPATLRLGPGPSAPYSDFAVVATGIASSARVGIDRFQIGFYDSTDVLDAPMSEGTFAGTNSGTVGLEGTAADIKGQRKPRAFGRVRDIEPVLLNAGTRIYGWNYTRAGNRAPTASVEQVRVRGSAWTFTTDYPNAAALAAASISVGYYGTCVAESLIRMGGSDPIDGAVRLDAIIGNGASANYAANLVQEILLDAGWGAGDISAVDLSTLNGLRPYDAQYYTQDDTARNAVSDLLASILAWGVPDANGVFRFGFVPTSVGAAQASIREVRPGVALAVDEVNLLQIESLLDETTKDVPAKSVQTRFGRKWGAQPRAVLAPALTDALKEAYSTEWLTTAKLDNAGVALQFENADEVIYDTLLVDAVAAAEVNTALAALLARRPKRYAVDIAATPDNIKLFQPGGRVNLYHRRLGMSNGYQGFITKAKVDARSRIVSLEVLGVGNV